LKLRDVRRNRHPRSLSLCSVFILLACSEAPPMPDILLISIDTLRADRVSSYGYERDTTPNIDRVATEGVRFAAAHAPSSVTAPSHMSMFTGLDPASHGVMVTVGFGCAQVFARC
jgi:arylsulfatase A-like enzyme